MIKQPFVSIILPVYNGEKTIKATLLSLLNQTYSNFELLIGIDGTHDDSKTIAEACNDTRITIFENPKNLGLGPNVNMLISKVTKDAKYIAMAEQDDIYVKERLQWQVDVLETSPNVGLVSGIAEFINNSGSVLFPGILIKGNQFPQGIDLFKYLYINQLKVVNTCMMLRKEVHQKNNLLFTNKYPNMNVDWDYVLRFSLVSEVFGIPKKLVTMNRGLVNESVTRNKDLQHKTSRRLLIDFKKEFSDLITKNNYKEALKMHRKIELGHHSKLGILFYSLYYFLLYFDAYFLKYPIMRIKKYFNN
jgi:glycosyltransferase involved in cell wall biosynthesis